MLDISKYMVHQCEIVSYDTTPATPDAWERTANYGGTPTPSECFCYFGKSELNLDTLVGVPRQVFSAPTMWQLVLPPRFMNTLQHKDKVQNIVDRFDAPIREEGYIKDFKTYRHWLHGPMFVLCILGDGDDS